MRPAATYSRNWRARASSAFGKGDCQTTRAVSVQGISAARRTGSVLAAYLRDGSAGALSAAVSGSDTDGSSDTITLRRTAGSSNTK